MPPAASRAVAPSLLGVTLRRAVSSGRIYLALGLGFPLLFAVLMLVRASPAYAYVIALFLPVFAVQGSMGATVVFTNDRIKGVLEYLMAYGISPRRIFFNVLLASLALVSLVIAVVLGVGLGGLWAQHASLPAETAEILTVYTVPMSYATVTFAATVGVYWTSLSTPRSGINSPTGVLPIIGVGPPVVTLAAVGVLSTNSLEVVVAAVGLVAGASLVLLCLAGRLMPRERLLSPA